VPCCPSLISRFNWPYTANRSEIRAKTHRFGPSWTALGSIGPQRFLLAGAGISALGRSRTFARPCGACGTRPLRGSTSARRAPQRAKASCAVRYRERSEAHPRPFGWQPKRVCACENSLHFAWATLTLSNCRLGQAKRYGTGQKTTQSPKLGLDAFASRRGWRHIGRNT